MHAAEETKGLKLAHGRAPERQPTRDCPVGPEPGFLQIGAHVGLVFGARPGRKCLLVSSLRVTDLVEKPGILSVAPWAGLGRMSPKEDG